MKSTLHLLSFVCIALCTTWSVEAQWVPTNGPAGTTAYRLFTTDGNILAGTNGGLFLSANEGQTWTPRSNGIAFPMIFDVAKKGSRLFVATNGSGLQRSDDNGQSWSNSNAGIPYTSFSAVAVINDVVLLGSYTNGGIYRSVDDGISWTKITDGIGGLETVLSFLVSGNNLYATTYSGIYLSTNNGESWSSINSNLPSTGISAFTLVGSDLIVSVQVGKQGYDIYKSDDQGASWSFVAATGLTDKQVWRFKEYNNILFASTASGLFVSEDAGSSWSLNTDAVIIANDFLEMNDKLFAATRYGIYYTDDSGSTWNQSDAGIATTMVNKLAGSSDNTIFAGTYYHGLQYSTDQGATWTSLFPKAGISNIAVINDVLFNYSNYTVKKSENKGATWADASSGLPGGQAYCLVSSGSKIYAGTYQGVFVSSDMGDSWSAINTGMTNSNIGSVVVSGSSIFAGVNNTGIYRSDDAGQSWALKNNGLNAFGVTSLYALDNAVFAATYNGGFYKSSDNGESWSQLVTTIPDNIAVGSFASYGNHLFIHNNNNVYLTSDLAESWTSVSEGLTGVTLSYLCIVGNYIYAGTQQNSVWKRPLNEMITLTSADNASISPTASVYPNPASDFVQIDNLKPGSTVSVTDLTGKTIYRQITADNQLTIAVSNFSEGIYILQTQFGDTTHNEKLIVTK